MSDLDKSKKALVQEVKLLRRRAAQVEAGVSSNRREADRIGEAQVRRMKAMLDSIPDMAWLKDVEGKFAAVNDASCKAFGMSYEELLGKTDFDVAPPDLAKRYVEDDKEVIRTGERKQKEEQWGRGEKDKIWVETIKTPVYNEKGDIIGVSGIARDITKRKEMEEKLRDSENKFRTLYDSTQDAVMLLDKDGFFDCNDATLRIFGCKSREEFCGKHPADLSPPIQPDGTDSMTLANERVATAMSEGSNHFEWVHQCIDGRRFPADVLLSAVELGGRRVLQAVVRDITERKRYEEGLKGARDKLEKRVKERTAELEKANEELQKEVLERKKAEEQLLQHQQELRSLASELTLSEERLKHRIAINVHDNIGQILATSKLQIEMLRDKDFSEKCSKVLDQISGQLAKAIESSRSLTMELSPPVLYELGFASALDWLVKRSREQYDFSVEFERSGDINGLEKDVEVLVFQAVRELLVNVAKHSGANQVRVKARRKGDSIEVTVEDDGVGFEVLQAGVGEDKNGGFGLFSVRERLGYLGGKFQIESRRGGGAVLTLSVPAGH